MKPTTHSPFTIPHSPFPLPLAIATILTTNLGLIAASANLQWAIASPTHDALALSWLYVNLPLLWTTLALWPALSRSSAHATLLLELITLFTAAIPALSVAAFLGNIPLIAILATLTLQLALALFAAGLLSWRPTLSAPFITGLLTTIAVILPLFAYLWAEFLPLAPQSWLALIPMLALTHAATSLPTHFLWCTTATYAILGAAFIATANRSAKT